MRLSPDGSWKRLCERTGRQSRLILRRTASVEEAWPGHIASLASQHADRAARIWPSEAWRRRRRTDHELRVSVAPGLSRTSVDTLSGAGGRGFSRARGMAEVPHLGPPRTIGGDVAPRRLAAQWVASRLDAQRVPSLSGQCQDFVDSPVSGLTSSPVRGLTQQEHRRSCTAVAVWKASGERDTEAQARHAERGTSHSSGAKSRRSREPRRSRRTRRARDPERANAFGRKRRGSSGLHTASVDALVSPRTGANVQKKRGSSRSGRGRLSGRAGGLAIRPLALVRPRRARQLIRGRRSAG